MRFAKSRPISTTPVRIIATLLVTSSLAGHGALAQSARVHFYHGRGNSTGRGYNIGAADIGSANGRPDYAFTLPAGREVCIDVLNPQPNIYAYSLDVAVDSSSEKAPDLGSLVAILKATLPVPPGAAGRSIPVSTPPFVAGFYTIFEPLATALETVQQDIKLSDDPEKSMPFAKASVARNLSKSPSADDLAKWAQKYYPSNLNGVDTMTFAALKAYGETLLNTRDAIRTSYGPGAQERLSKCQTIGAGRTTIKLKVAKKGDTGMRDVGDALLTVTVDSRYERKLLELFPVVYAAHADNVPQFTADTNIVRMKEGEFVRSFRAGGVAILNLPGSGEIAYGVGAGFGVGGDNKLSLADFFGAGAVSYRDWIRVGAGIGSSEMAIGVKAPAVVNQALPTGTKLNDLLEKGQRRAWFLFIAIPSLAIKSPF